MLDLLAGAGIAGHAGGAAADFEGAEAHDLDLLAGGQGSRR